MTKIILSRYDGHLYDALCFTAGDMPIEHIAHNLAYINRYNGAQPYPMSVALHSILVARLVAPKYAYEALLHDATEAIVGDMAHSIKELCPDFRRIEYQVKLQLCDIYGLSSIEPVEVKRADVRARDLECYVLRGVHPAMPFTREEKIECINLMDSVTSNPDVVATSFLHEYDKLREELAA